MKKQAIIWLISIIMVGVMSQTVGALSATLPLCDVSGKVSVGENCTIVTPSIRCQPTEFYDIINLSGAEVVNNAPLFELNETIFFFNFTLTSEPNDFIIRLCDDTTREIQVVQGGSGGVTQADMAFIAIALLIIGMVFILYKASVELDEAHWPLKTGLFYGALLLGWAALAIAIRLGIDISSSTELISNLNTLYRAYILITVLAFGYLFIRIFWWLGLKGFGKTPDTGDKGF